MTEKIVCEICGEEIEPLPRETPIEEREYKADMVIARDAYWNDIGIFTIIHTRQFFHKSCFENAKQYFRQMVEKRD